MWRCLLACSSAAALMALSACDQSGARAQSASSLSQGARAAESTGTLSGQVFVAAVPGKNLKLGAVEVLAFSEQSIIQHINGCDAESDRKLAPLRQRADEAFKRYADASRAAAPAASNVFVLRSELEQKKASLDEALKRRAATDSGARDLDAQIKAQQSVLAKGERAIAQAEHEAAAMTKAFGGNQKNEATQKALAEAKTLRAAQTEIEQRITALLKERQSLEATQADRAKDVQRQQQSVIDVEEKLSKAATNAAAAAAPVEAASRTLRAVNDEIDSIHVQDCYFANLPVPVARTTTDAEGKFTLRLPLGQRLAIFAELPRRDSSQALRWLVWVRTDPAVAQPVLLNNVNLFGSESADQVISRKALNLVK